MKLDNLDIRKLLVLEQEELLQFCNNELLKRGYRKGKLTEDYLYAKGNIPVLLVAHCDTVHKEKPETIVYDKENQMLWSPEGIGGDDRCGVYAILEITKTFKPYVLFTTDEEIGGIGAKKFIEENAELPVNFIIEIDRRGNEQVVFYDCGNKDFQNYILSFGFDLNYGSFSDVSALSTSYDIAGCNVSAGYYNEHTKTEYIDMNHLFNSINKIKDILKDKKNHKFYDCQEVKYEPIKTFGKYSYNYFDGWYDDDYYDNYYESYSTASKTKEIDEAIIEKEDDYFDLTDEEWEEKYGSKRPESIKDIYTDIGEIEDESK